MVSDDLIRTRHSLVQRLKNWDDEGSWEDFFKTYWKLIYAVATKAGLTDAEAQDVVQETLITVSKRIKDFEVGSEHSSFKSWLLQTTRWRIVDQFRKRTQAQAHLGAKTDEASRTATVERVADPASLDVEEAWEAGWNRNLSEAALENVRSRVDPEYYQMFDLHLLKGWPAAKVAGRLGVKMGKVYFAKYKISRLLKKEVKRLKAKIV